MPKVKAGTARKTISEKIAIGINRVTALTGNTSVAVDPAKLTLFATSVSGLQNSQAEVGNAQVLLTEKYAKQSDAEKEYDLQTLVMVSEIISLTQDEAKLSTTGFPISDTGPIEPELKSSPANVMAVMGKKAGEIGLG